MRNKGILLALFVALFSFALVTEAFAEGSLSKVRSFFKGRTRTTITGTVDRDGEKILLKAEDGKTYELNGKPADKLVEEHKGASVRVTGYAQKDTFEVRRYQAVEDAAKVETAAKTDESEETAEPARDEEKEAEIRAAQEDEDLPAAKPRRNKKRAAAVEEDADTTSTPDATSGATKSYTVEKGDTLAEISKKFYGTTKNWQKIQKHNNIKNVKAIKPGMVLEIPVAE